MRLFLPLFIVLVSRPLVAANEEQFQWMGVNFCHTSVGEVIERFPDARYFGDFELLAVTDSGETLGAGYDELFFHVLPDGKILGVIVTIDSGDIEEIEKNLDRLAARRWGDKARKDRINGNVTWWREAGLGFDIHMHLLSDETSPLYNIGQSKDDRKSSVIALSSIAGCNRH